MSPRRLLAYAAVFLVLAGGYVALQWHQAQKAQKEEQAKKVFAVKEAEIQELSLVRGKEETRLIKKDNKWEIVKPVAAKADQARVLTLLTTLANLASERDLTPEGDLKAFGVEPPELLLSFTAGGKTHHLAIGAKAPGERRQSFYARKDQGPSILLISASNKGALDLKLMALRDKTLLTFAPEGVKAVALKSGKTEVRLERTGPQTWRWAGRPEFKIRSDRVEQLLAHLKAATVMQFLDQQPTNLKEVGLAPAPLVEVTLTTADGQEILTLGTVKKNEAVYARKGAAGPVVMVSQQLATEVSQAASSLEDRRLFTGSLPEVHKIVWGPPDKLLTAVKEQPFWKITGAGKDEVRQYEGRGEIALRALDYVEFTKTLPPPATPRKAVYLLELFDAAGKSLFRLENTGKETPAGLEVLTRTGEKSVLAVVPKDKFGEWQQQMTEFATPPPPEE